MAITVTKSGLTIEIKGTTGTIDADWDFTDDVDDTGMFISSIQFNPASTDDECVIKEGGATGAIMFYALCANGYDQKVKYFHGERKHPFLDVSAGNYTSGAKVVIEISEIPG